MNKYEIGNMYTFIKCGNEKYIIVWASNITSYRDNSIDKSIHQERIRYYET
jgi:hypothetical protein